MLTLRLTNCIECLDISVLLQDIDCKLTDLAKIMYNNTVFAFNYPVDGNVFSDLLHYKRILTARACNSEYAITTGCTDCASYTNEVIGSRIKLLKFK